MIRNYSKYKPKINSRTYISKQSLIIGKVTIAKDASIWPGCVLRGDVEEIFIGEATNLQDGVLVHTNFALPVVIGQKVTVGHGAILHGCKIGANCLIGMGAIILDGAVIGDNCIIGAGSVVTEHAQVRSGSLVLGVPGKIVRKVNEEEIKKLEKSADEYVELSRIYEKAQNI
jgi:carbonic anhydrase/acetyltransferase-like protein (isoleucine patch superfamily)